MNTLEVRTSRLYPWRVSNINNQKALVRVVKGLQNQISKLKAVFKKEGKVLLAYLFGSYAKGNQTAKSDVDIAVLLSETPQKILRYYLHLVDELSQLLGNEVDLIILNKAPPLLKFQVIKHGKVVYCKDEKARIEFEARVQDEYLDFNRALARYEECLLKEVLA